MRELDRKVIFSVPNIMTFARVAVIPFILILMILQDPDRPIKTNQILSLSVAALFILAAISDLVDGYYARRYGMVSLMGKFFDPMADKLVHMSVMVMFVSIGRMAAWWVVILLFREILITGLRAIAAGEGLIIGAGESGKKKTAFMNVGLSGMLIYYPFFGVQWYSAGVVCAVIGTFYAMYSGAEYMILFFREIAKRK